MLTLVQNRALVPSSAETASLAADYRTFDRKRTSRRQYMKAFGGMAIIVLIGAAFGRVPADEAWIVAGLLSLTPLVLGIFEYIHWRRLIRRLRLVRTEVQSCRQRDASEQKVVKKA